MGPPKCLQVKGHKRTYRLYLPQNTCEDFSACHPDDIDWDDCETSVAALDTLSELSTRASSQSSLVEPHGQRDLALKRVEEQRVAWESSNSSKPTKKTNAELDALVLQFQKAMDLGVDTSTKKTMPIAEKDTGKQPPEIPAHVSCTGSSVFS